MATNELSQIPQLDISDILKKDPNEHELLDLLADIDDKWYEVGLTFKVPHNILSGLRHSHESNIVKLSEVIYCWKTTTEPNLVTWETAIAAFEEGRIINNKIVANKMREYLTKAKEKALKRYFTTLSQSLINPVKISQMLFSERCINETTLEMIEMSEGSLDEKKTTILSAICTAVFSDCKKLKGLATVLSKFEETKLLSERIISEYAQKCPDDQMTTVREVAMTHSDHQYQPSYSLESIESKHTMDDMEYQQSYEMVELSTSNTRKRLRKDKEISDDDLKPKKERLDLEASSDSNEQAFLASDILRCHYGTLSQCLKYPVRVAQLLHDEGVISKDVLANIQEKQCSQSEENAIVVLLQAVRHAVHSIYHNLEVFASVLLKQTNNVPCANAIIWDCKKAFSDYDLQVAHTGSSEGNQTFGNPLTTSSQDKALKPIPIPRKFNSLFGQIRIEFGITFSKIREAINKSPPPLEKLKSFVADTYPHLKSQITYSKSIDDVIDVVRDHCTLININCLEGIVKRFNIKEAEIIIEAYKTFIQSFCQKANASLCLEETFKENKSHSLLKCETAVFVLDWDPIDYTLQDIRDIIAESVEENVQIRVIRKDWSISVTCFFPFSLTMSLILKAQETLESVKKKGLIQLTIGYCTIYDKCKRNVQQKENEIMQIDSIEETKDIIRYFPPENYELLIIGSYGEVSNAIEVAPKIIPRGQKGSNEWMTKEIGLIKEKHEQSCYCNKSDVSDYSELPGKKQHSKDYYLKKIKEFLINCKHNKAIIFYTGHGEKNTGNWCFIDGIIGFEDIYSLYFRYFRRKRLTINSDCSYSGNWIKDCAKTLDGLNILSCGHYTMEVGILLNVWCSCDVEEEATALCYVNEAIRFDEDEQSVVTDFNTELTSGQNTKLGDFRQIRCSKKVDESCEVGLYPKCTWMDCVFPKSHLVYLVRSRMWQYVQVDKHKVDEFKTRVSAGKVNVADYGRVLYAGWGQDPPPEVTHQVGSRCI